MKKRKASIKRTIKKKIDLKQGQYKKYNTNIKKMGSAERDAMRTGKTPRKPAIPVDLVGRNTMRMQHNRTEINYRPVPENKSPVSIVVTAFQTQDYIEECLDSIEKQSYFVNNDNFEVLVGVDGCEETLKKLLKIRGKYRNLRIFSMKKNVGTFIVTNTLIDIMNTDNFIRFDSDDIMLPQMVNEIMHFSNDFDIIKFSYYNFNKMGEFRLKTLGNKFAAGVIFYKKRVFDLYGGYQPWICTAEGEILIRIGGRLPTKEITLGLFRRRIHLNSLTQNNDTGMKSELRKQYHIMIEKNRKNNVKKIERIVGEYDEKK